MHRNRHSRDDTDSHSSTLRDRSCLARMMISNQPRWRHSILRMRNCTCGEDYEEYPGFGAMYPGDSELTQDVCFECRSLYVVTLSVLSEPTFEWAVSALSVCHCMLFHSIHPCHCLIAVFKTANTNWRTWSNGACWITIQHRRFSTRRSIMKYCRLLAMQMSKCVVFRQGLCVCVCVCVVCVV